MKISQLSDTKVLISLCADDMKNFKLEFDEMTLSDAHSKKILNRLLHLACTKSALTSKHKAILCEALPSDDGCMLFLSFADKQSSRKKYRIKRITEYPCYRFSCVEDLLCAIERLYNTDVLFYNNSVYLYKDRYYLVFDYPIVAQKAQKILLEYAHKLKGSKPFVARLHENAKNISQGNAIIHIGTSF